MPNSELRDNKVQLQHDTPNSRGTKTAKNRGMQAEKPSLVMQMVSANMLFLHESKDRCTPQITTSSSCHTTQKFTNSGSTLIESQASS